MFEDLTIDLVVDKLKEVRDVIKTAQAEEKELKKIILATGEKTIQGVNHKMTISERTSESFNETAFLEYFKNESIYDEELKSKIINTKEFINQEELQKACLEGEIEVSIVEPYVEIKTSEVINVK